MASFVLSTAHVRDETLASVLTTGVLVLIALVGLRRGLGGLERMEEFAVNLKLAIIAAFLLGLAWFDAGWFGQHQPLTVDELDGDWFDRARLLAGLLLIVQGFETSRYLGDAYDAPTRIRTMQRAQGIAALIYVVFVVLGLPLLSEIRGEADETALLIVAGKVSALLPAMLIVAAAMSQFSAAVADTAGAGGLFRELLGGRLDGSKSYVAIVAAAIVLVWSANVFEIIALASRAFALYYLLQCLVALLANRHCRDLPGHRLRMAAFGTLALLLSAVVVLAIPAA
jgi:hypothetical protein